MYDNVVVTAGTGSSWESSLYLTPVPADHVRNAKLYSFWTMVPDGSVCRKLNEPLSTTDVI